MADKILDPIHAKAFERRGISAETAARYEIYTDGKVVVFPYFEHGAVVNEKYRAPGKKFWQTKGGKRTFWNADALDDPALETGQMALVITEGEIDALTAIECGFPLAVSVPDGAPPATSEDREDDDEKKFEFIYNNRNRIKYIKRFIIAVDNDDPGKRLAEGLVRRLSASRCSFVDYPAGCKDLNDVLQQYGSAVVRDLLLNAKPYPIKGVYQLSDYPPQPKLVTYSTGWAMIDQHMMLFPKELMVVTGIPGHGKSTWVLNLICNMARLHDWKTVLFSPEMPVNPHLRDKLRRIISADIASADAFIDKNIKFLDHSPTDDDDDDDLSVEWIIDKAKEAVLRYGIRCLVIDPWNEIEHARHRDEAVTDYVCRCLRQLKAFAKNYQVAVIVIAHPTKEVFKDGKLRTPSLYDIEGSAHWVNKCDHGIVIERPNPYADEAMIHISKVRFEDSGERGEVKMDFDRATSQFLTLGTKP